MAACASVTFHLKEDTDEDVFKMTQDTPVLLIFIKTNSSA